MPVDPGKTREAKLAHLHAALGYVTRWRTAVDVGAHVGGWTKIMAERFKAVHCFEPVQALVAQLHKLARITPNIHLHRCALGHVAGSFHLMGEKHSLNWIDFSKRGCNRADERECVVKRLDDYNLEDVDLLKIDAEGADLLVLRGGDDTIRRCRPVIIMESKPDFEERYKIAPHEIEDFMRKRKYELKEVHRYDFIWLPK